MKNEAEVLPGIHDFWGVSPPKGCVAPQKLKKSAEIKNVSRTRFFDRHVFLIEKIFPRKFDFCEFFRI